LEQLKITKKILIKGDFLGKYQGDEVISKDGPNISDYKIDVVEGEISNGIKCDYIEYISNDSLSLELAKLDNVKIRLDDPSIKKNKAVFVEDLEDVIIYDIEFSEVLHEVDGSFGIIKGKIYGSISYEEEVILAKEPPEKTSEIVKEKAKVLKEKAKVVKDKVKYGAYPLLSTLFYIFLFICLAAVFKENLIYLLLFGAGIYLFKTIVVYLIELLFRSSYAVFILLILIGLFSFFTNGFESIDEDEEIEIVETDPPEYNEIISRKINWNDYENRRYSGDFRFYYGDYIKSKNYRENISWSNNSTWGSIYNKISKNEISENRLDLIYNTLNQIKTTRKLSYVEFAEVIVSLIQKIPYNYVFSGSCNDPTLPLKYIQAIRNGTKCHANINHSLFSPMEFFYNKGGDCDSRTVLLYTLLKKYNYDVVILNSDLYGHSILGVNLPTRGKYKLYNNKKYHFWETTGVGWKRGEIPPEWGDVSKWFVALK
jgi:energy-coupling factor transporter transmembrane protein EcfT